MPATNVFYLHVVFDPKNFKKGEPQNEVWKRFVNPKINEGPSCFKTGQGHGPNIKWRTIELWRSHAPGSEAIYLYFDEESFLSHSFLPPETAKKVGQHNIFILDPRPTPKSPTHTVVLLMEGLKSVKECPDKPESRKVLEYNGQRVSDKDKAYIINQLRFYFKNRWCPIQQADRDGWFSDCLLQKHGRCENSNGPLNCSKAITE